MFYGEEKNKGNKSSLHRIFSLMRKMKTTKSYLLEGLSLNTELKQEKEMAEQGCNSSVDLKAKRIIFFIHFPISKRWDKRDQLPDEYILRYAVVITLTLPNQKCCS